ncbi:MAG: helix-turn-helix domain-containing protein, partial [Fibrobacterota bacterium]
MQKRTLIAERENSFLELPEDFPIAYSYYEFSDKRIKSLHIHENPEIGLCLEGSGIFVIEDRAVNFKKGDMIFINRLAGHRACSPRGSICRWHFIYLDPDGLLNNIPEPMAISPTKLFSSLPDSVSSDDFPNAADTIKKTALEFNKENRAEKSKIKALIWLFFMEISGAASSIDLEGKEQTQDTREIIRLRPALEAIARCDSDDLSIEKLAKRCFMSAGHFRRVFGKTMGKSPKEYINDYRISLACGLLENTSLSVSEISHRTGYRTLSCFNR